MMSSFVIIIPDKIKIIVFIKGISKELNHLMPKKGWCRITDQFLLKRLIRDESKLKKLK